MSEIDGSRVKTVALRLAIVGLLAGLWAARLWRRASRVEMSAVGQRFSRAISLCVPVRSRHSSGR